MKDLFLFFVVFYSLQDYVKFLIFEDCAALGKLWESQDCISHLLLVIVDFSHVRLSSYSLQYSLYWMYLVPMHVLLLRDNEIDVSIVAVIKESFSDSSQHVLSHLASVKT